MSALMSLLGLEPDSEHSSLYLFDGAQVTLRTTRCGRTWLRVHAMALEDWSGWWDSPEEALDAADRRLREIYARIGPGPHDLPVNPDGPPAAERTDGDGRLG